MQCLTKDRQSGMIVSPQFFLYSAGASLMNSTAKTPTNSYVFILKIKKRPL